MSQCKGCGREIIWAKSPAGKNTPYERVQAFEQDGKSFPFQMVKIETTTVYVSHFTTCPKANDFSASKKPVQTSFLDDALNSGDGSYKP